MRKSSDSQKESEDEQDGGWQWGEVGNQRTEGKSLRALLVCKIIYPRSSKGVLTQGHPLYFVIFGFPIIFTLPFRVFAVDEVDFASTTK